MTATSASDWDIKTRKLEATFVVNLFCCNNMNVCAKSQRTLTETDTSHLFVQPREQMELLLKREEHTKEQRSHFTGNEMETEATRVTQAMKWCKEVALKSASHFIREEYTSCSTGRSVDVTTDTKTTVILHPSSLMVWEIENTCRCQNKNKVFWKKT